MHILITALAFLSFLVVPGFAQNPAPQTGRPDFTIEKGPPENPGKGYGPPENPREDYRHGSPDTLFEQETYLFQKEPADAGPWKILLPNVGLDEEGDLEISHPFAKLEYYNYPINDYESGENLGFCFDLKGYGLPEGEYALIYYVDPGPGAWDAPPAVYVFGTGVVPREDPASEDGEENGEAEGMRWANLKIEGCCQLDAIPVADDVNYPNGGKVWLIPTEYIDTTESGSWGQMAGWPSDVTEILFETSLITYGEAAEPDTASGE